jgi:hypothetical protein
MRAIPSTNVIRIQTSTDDAIERPEYGRTIEAPIAIAIRRNGLHDLLEHATSHRDELHWPGL